MRAEDGLGSVRPARSPERAGDPGVPPLAGTLGTFDSAGQASASFKLPPGLASSLVGLVAHHAYVTFDGSTGQPLATSNAAPLLFVP